MEEFAMLLLALGALSVLSTNMVLTIKLLYQQKQEPPAERKSEEELEIERKRLEKQRLELEGRENMMAYSGFLWKDGGSN